ncbi:MAG: GerMN domain-containing protein [Tuberibacillus sp.]
MRKRLVSKFSICAIALMIPLIGCGIEKQSGSNINPPPGKVNAVKKSDEQTKAANAQKAGEKSEKLVERELYLIDANGHVTPQTFKLPNVDAPAQKVLEYLVKDGPVEELLPTGFQAVLPAGTTFTMNLKDGVLTVDFSKDFENYKAKDEEKMLEAITWTLTQFDSIKKVKLSVNGKALTKMPVAKTPIDRDGLSRADGINLSLGNVVDITGSDSVVVYYLSQNNNGDTYYVPVTQRIDATKDILTAKVNALINPPASDPTLVSPINSDAALVNAPVVKDGVVTLNFNDQFFADSKKKVVSDKAVNCLALSLIGEKGIKKVSVEVKGQTEMTTESGKALTKPVTKPIINKTGI